MQKLLHQLFEVQAKISPNNIAVVCKNKSLTYKELNDKTNQIARTLRSLYLQFYDKEQNPMY